MQRVWASRRMLEEAFAALVRALDFKSSGGRGDTSPAGSIPVRFRRGVENQRGPGMAQTPTVVISFKDVDHDEQTRESIEKRCGRLAEEFQETAKFEVTLSPDGSSFSAHGRVTGKDTEAATHANGDDAAQASDRLLDKLERLLRRAHDKRIFAHRREAQRTKQQLKS